MTQKKKNPEIKSDFLLLRDAARYCDYSQEYLSLRARQGKLKAVKFGRNWMTRKEWIEEYVRKVEEYNRKVRKTKPEPLEEVSIERVGFFQKIFTPSVFKLRPALALALIFLLLFSSMVLGKESLKTILQKTLFYVQQTTKTIDYVLKESKKSLASSLDSLNQTFINVAQVIKTTDYEDFKTPIPLFKEYFKWLGNSLKTVFVQKPKALVKGILDYGNYLAKKLKKGWQFLVLEFQTKTKELKEFVISLFKPRIVEKEPEKPILVEVTKEEFEKLKQEIQTIKREGLPVREVVKEIEVSRITKVQPLKEITKEIKILDDESLKIIRANLLQQETDVEKLKLAASLGYVRLPTILSLSGDISIIILGTITTGTWQGTAIGTRYGGSGADLSAGAQGGIVYMGASSIMGISAAGTSGYALISGGTGVPTWTNTPDWSTLTLSSSVTSPLYTGTGAVTLSSGGAGDLTLDSDSGTVQLAAGDSLTVPGTITGEGQLIATKAPTQAHTGTWSVDSETWQADDATIYINPSTATGDSNLLGLAVNGSVKFAIDAEGDIFGNNLILEGSTSAATTTITGDLKVEGNTTLGDTSTDTLTFNASTLAIANNLNIDSDTLFIDASGNMVGIGTTGPDRILDVLDASNPQLRLTQADGTVYSEFQTASTGSLTITTSATAGADDIVFETAGTEKMRILENGDLFFEKGASDVTLTVSAPAAPRTYTIPDFGADVSFVGSNRQIATTSPLSGGGDLSDNRTLTLAGLSSLGTGNYVVGVDTGATAWEYKNVVGTASEVDIAHSAGQIQIGLIDPLTVSKGGTGLTSLASGALLYGSGSSPMNTLTIGTANKVLTSSGTIPQWSTNIAVGALPTGGNWDITSDLTIETPTLFIGNDDGSYAGRVGIGATPSYKLDVSGDINFTGKLREDGNEILSGVIAAFAGSCPTGWTEYIAARGRTIVGTPSGGTNEGLVGTALGNLGTRTITDVASHLHTFTGNALPGHAHFMFKGGSGSTTIGWGSASYVYSQRELTGDVDYKLSTAGANVANTGVTKSVSAGTPSGTISTTGVASVDVTMPYIQLTYCQKSAGADLAEWIPTSEDISDETIVSIDPNNREKIITARKPYDPTVVGIISSEPGWLIGEEKSESVQMALAGRVPTRVSLMNGEIKPGDPITTSFIPGVGMKATKSGPIVGKAMEALNETSSLINCYNPITGIKEKCGTILVFVNISWFNPENNQSQEDTILAKSSGAYYELLRFGDDLSDGDLVSLEYGEAPNQKDPTKLETVSYISKTRDYSSKTYVGVISNTIGGKGDLLRRGRVNNQIISETRLIFTGNTKVKISPSSEPIQPGDFLSSSDDPGMAKKTTTVGLTIGKALEKWTPGSDKDKIMIFVNLGWYDPDVYLADTEDIKILRNEVTNLGIVDSFVQEVKQALANLGLFIENGIVRIKELVVEKLKIGSQEEPSGITLYDEETGEPYCVKMKGGELISLPGECDDNTEVGPMENSPEATGAEPLQDEPEEEPLEEANIEEVAPPQEERPPAAEEPAPEPEPEPELEPEPEPQPTVDQPQAGESEAEPSSEPTATIEPEPTP